MHRQSCSPGPAKDERKKHIDRLLRELDKLLQEEYRDTGDPGTLDEIEEESDRIAEGVRRIVSDKLLRKKERDAQQPQPPRECTCRCGAQARYKECRTRQFVLRSGLHRLTRAYYYCAVCRHGFCPLDAALVLPSGQYSPRVATLMVRLNMLFPDRQAVRELHELLGLDPAVSTVQRYSRRVGQRLAEEWHQQEEQWRKDRLPESQKHPKRLVLTMDAFKLHVGGEWRDAKIAAAYELNDKGRAASTQFTATMEASTEFGKRLPVLARHSGADHCRDIEVIGDGANWIWQETGKYYPTSVQVLDYSHATEHLWVAARARYGDGTKECKDWADELKGVMYNEKQAELLDQIKAWQPRNKDKRDIRRCLFNYLIEHKDRMAYKTLDDKGYHIGSGVIEASCKNVGQIRMKRAGQRWKQPAAEAMLHLCAYACSAGTAGFRQYV